MSDRVEADPSGRAIDPGEYAAKEATWAYSGRDETLQPIRYLDGLDEAFARDWLGGCDTVEDLHDLAGVPAGARVSVSSAAHGRLAIAALGQTRLRNREGAEVVVRYQTLVHVPLSARSGGKAAPVVKFQYCTSEPPRSGFGTDAIVRMVAACERLGLDFIEGVLAGDGHDESDTSSGYYAWPALGFDAPLLLWEDFPDRPLPEELQQKPNGDAVIFVQDLFRVLGGGAWWRQHGSTLVGIFTVAKKSVSRLRLQDAVDKLAQERGTK